MEVSLLQIINTKMLTKSACSSRVLIQYVNRKILQFYNGFLSIFTIWRLWKTKNFVNLNWQNLTFFLILSNFPDFCHFFKFFLTFPNRVATLIVVILIVARGRVWDWCFFTIKKNVIENKNYIFFMKSIFLYSYSHYTYYFPNNKYDKILYSLVLNFFIYLIYIFKKD